MDRNSQRAVKHPAPFSLLTLWLLSVSAHIVSKLSKEVVKLFLQPCLFETNVGFWYYSRCILVSALSSSILSTSEFTLMTMMIKEEMVETSSPFLSILFHSASPLQPGLVLGSYSRHYLGFGELSQLLRRATFFPLPLLCIVTDVRKWHSYLEKSLQQHRIQASIEKLFKNLYFIQKKSSLENLKKTQEIYCSRLPLVQCHSGVDLMFKIQNWILGCGSNCAPALWNKLPAGTLLCVLSLLL